jgi:hypothetical protein
VTTTAKWKRSQVSQHPDLCGAAHVGRSAGQSVWVNANCASPKFTPEPEGVGSSPTPASPLKGSGFGRRRCRPWRHRLMRRVRRPVNRLGWNSRLRRNPGVCRNIASRRDPGMTGIVLLWRQRQDNWMRWHSRRDAVGRQDDRMRRTRRRNHDRMCRHSRPYRIGWDDNRMRRENRDVDRMGWNARTDRIRRDHDWVRRIVPLRRRGHNRMSRDAGRRFEWNALDNK